MNDFKGWTKEQVLAEVKVVEAELTYIRDGHQAEPLDKLIEGVSPCLQHSYSITKREAKKRDLVTKLFLLDKATIGK